MSASLAAIRSVQRMWTLCVVGAGSSGYAMETSRPSASPLPARVRATPFSQQIAGLEEVRSGRAHARHRPSRRPQHDSQRPRRPGAPTRRARSGGRPRRRPEWPRPTAGRPTPERSSLRVSPDPELAWPDRLVQYVAQAFGPACSYVAQAFRPARRWIVAIPADVRKCRGSLLARCFQLIGSWAGSVRTRLAPKPRRRYNEAGTYAFTSSEDSRCDPQSSRS